MIQKTKTHLSMGDNSGEQHHGQVAPGRGHLFPICSLLIHATLGGVEGQGQEGGSGGGLRGEG